MNKLKLITLIFVLTTSLIYSQDIPRVISYQGVIVDKNGIPETRDNVKFSFTFYNSQEGGQIVVPKQERILTVVGGLFNTMLFIPENTNLNQLLWLEIEVEGKVFPNRIQMATSIYALNIADKIVTERKIANNSINSDKIIDGTIKLNDLSSGTFPNAIIKWDGSKWNYTQDEGLISVNVSEPLTGDGTNSNPVRINIDNLIPIGTIVAYWGNNPPDGWLICDGSVIPNTYANLKSFLGSDVTPDLRGMFLRGANTTINKSSRGDIGDPDEQLRIGGIGVSKIGSIQLDAIMKHQHRTNAPTPGNDPNQSAYGYSSSNPRVILGVSDINQSHAALTDHGFVPPPYIKISSETRPKNVYVNFIIKAR